MGLGRFVENEARKAVVTEIMPFDEGWKAGEEAGGEGGGAQMRLLQRRMGEWMVEQQVRNDPEMREVQGRVVRRRRENAPKGAKGT